MFHSTTQDDHNNYQSQLNSLESPSIQSEYLVCLHAWQQELSEITAYVKSYPYDVVKPSIPTISANSIITPQITFEQNNPPMTSESLRTELESAKAIKTAQNISYTQKESNRTKELEMQVPDIKQENLNELHTQSNTQLNTQSNIQSNTQSYTESYTESHTQLYASSHPKNSHHTNSLWKRQGFTPIPYQPATATHSNQNKDHENSVNKAPIHLNFAMAEQIELEHRAQQAKSEQRKPSPTSVTQLLIDPLDDEALEAEAQLHYEIQTPIAQKLVQVYHDEQDYINHHDVSSSVSMYDAPSLVEIDAEAFAGQISIPPQPQLDELSEGWSTLLETQDPPENKMTLIKWVLITFVLLSLGITVAYHIPFN
jgi:hypothetical protein